MRKKITAGFIGGLVMVAAVGCDAPTIAVGGAPVAVVQPSEAAITSLFTQWNAALATGDPQKVADLYAPNAVLLPTVSNQIRTDRAGIVDYFTEFLKKTPRGAITQSVVDVLDADDAINTGTYTFTLTVDGKTKIVPARYTFVYELVGGKWLIVNHHSSAMPES
jgi:uncharacterized protein (TIGR02246 family)